MQRRGRGQGQGQTRFSGLVTTNSGSRYVNGLRNNRNTRGRHGRSSYGYTSNQRRNVRPRGYFHSQANQFESGINRHSNAREYATSNYFGAPAYASRQAQYQSMAAQGQLTRRQRGRGKSRKNRR